MPQVFKSIALVGNAKDLRVAECMLGLAAHFQARGMPVLVDPSVGLAFKAGSVVLCPEQSFANRADLIVAIGGECERMPRGEKHPAAPADPTPPAGRPAEATAAHPPHP